MTDPPCRWAEHVVTIDDVAFWALYFDDCVHSIPALEELDEVFMLLEARAEEPENRETYTHMRAAIALRIGELERT